MKLDSEVTQISIIYSQGIIAFSKICVGNVSHLKLKYLYIDGNLNQDDEKSAFLYPTPSDLPEI